MSSIINLASVAYGYCKACRKMKFGKVEIGSPTVNAESTPVGRIGDTVRASCGHSGKIFTGSPTVSADGRPVATLMSKYVGTYSGRFIRGALTVEVGNGV